MIGLLQDELAKIYQFGMRSHIILHDDGTLDIGHVFVSYEMEEAFCIGNI